MSGDEIAAAVAAFRIGPPMDAVLGQPVYDPHGWDPHISIPRLRDRDGGRVGPVSVSLAHGGAPDPLTVDGLHRWLFGWCVYVAVHEMSESVRVHGVRRWDPHASGHEVLGLVEALERVGAEVGRW